MPGFGLDFGTTNSAIAVADAGGVRLARFGAAGTATFRSVLFFDPEERKNNKPLSVAGPDAIERYLDADGAGREGDRRILGVEGVALAGDAFDAKIVRHLVAPELGRGARYTIQGKEMTVPPWLFSHLERWHHLSFLKTRENLQLLERIHDGAEGRDRDRIAAFRNVVDNDLAYHLYRAVERVKVELSSRPYATLRFADPRIE